ncbi:unnamed protein product [Schistosoma curassoni]|uniref:Uncharacterized protein n=1 Tax=Schistosoma curassoni TaxID=6186 RepID=A0A183KH52_9TREM|nr:unnamed protein product [Schistosoma curassoni]
MTCLSITIYHIHNNFWLHLVRMLFFILWYDVVYLVYT